MTGDSLAKTAKLAKKNFCLGIPWRSWRLGESLSLLLILWMSAADAETIGTVSSSSNILTVSITVNDEGRPGYSITRAGRPIVTESRLGVRRGDTLQLKLAPGGGQAIRFQAR